MIPANIAKHHTLPKTKLFVLLYTANSTVKFQNLTNNLQHYLDPE